MYGMTQIKDITGEAFGCLVVIARAPNSRTGAVMWLCSCVADRGGCGGSVEAFSQNLRSGRTTSCGCTYARAKAARATRHGHASRSGRTAEWLSWHAMRRRCDDARSPAFRDYGGRGITVCERWRSFEAFLADMGRRPSAAHSIDRINNDGNYEPGNCRWATQTEQSRNQRSNRMSTHNGQTKCTAEWAEASGIAYSTLKSRLLRGMSIEDAVSLSADRNDRRRKYTIGSETMTLAQWARKTGVDRDVAATRLCRGWPIERAILPVTRAQ